MKRTGNRRGAVSVELMLAMPMLLAAVGGMVHLFNAHYARQRTIASMREVARQAVFEKRDIRSFDAHREAPCRVQTLKVRETSSLDKAEESLCRAAGYSPKRELRRVRVEAETTCRLAVVPALRRDVKIEAVYQATWLKKKQ